MSQFYNNNASGSIPGGTYVKTLTGNSGGAVSSDAVNSNINTVGTGSITVVGNPGTNTLTAQLTGLTNHNVLVGAGSATVTKVAPSATAGVPLISQGASSDPAFGTAVVAGGGTGDTSFTAYSVLCGGTTSTGALQNVSGVGTSGQVLTSNGAAALPTWQAAGGGGGITTIAGNTGTATGSTVTFSAPTAQVGASNAFVASGSTVTLETFVGGDLFWGAGTGVVVNGGNTIFGVSSLTSLVAGSTQNTGIGTETLTLMTTGSLNCFVGNFIGGDLLTGSNNCFFGNGDGISNFVGSAYTGSESNNIIVMNNGVIGDNHVIRIGTDGSGTGQQSTCFIAGIKGSTVTGSAVFINTSTGQLGLTVSSERFKEDIETLESTPVSSLRPVSFVYKNDETQRTQYGLIAEEVALIMPELVEYQDGQPYTVHYHMLAPLLLAEIKDLKSRICKLEQQHGL